MCSNNKHFYFVTGRSKNNFSEEYGEIDCDTVLIIIVRLHFSNSYKRFKIW